MSLSEPKIDTLANPDMLRSYDALDIELVADTPHRERTTQKAQNYRQNTQNKRLNRWPRAVARLVDTSWELVLIAGLLLVFLATRTDHITSGSFLFFMVLFVSLPLALGLDAIIAAIAGNTPAKALVGVKASSSRGGRVGFAKHLKRNYGVWTDGMGMGVLPITLFTAMSQFKRVSGRREAIYDERLHLRVSSSNWAGTRATLLLLSMLASFVLLTGSGLSSIKSVSASLTSLLNRDSVPVVTATVDSEAEAQQQNPSTGDLDAARTR